MGGRHANGGILIGVRPIALRRVIRRHRRNSVNVLAVVAILGAVALHHSGLEHPGDHGGMGAMTMTMCVGAFATVGAAVAAVVVGVIGLGRWRVPGPTQISNILVPSRPSQARARGRPPSLQHLCVLRI